MKKIQKLLFNLQDTSYADFMSSLIPDIKRETVIGVRVPQLRKLSVKLLKGDFNEGDIKIDRNEIEGFLTELPHEFYEENFLHMLLISSEKDFKKCINQINLFLPFVDNWAVCDIPRPACFSENHRELFFETEKWILSEKPYTIRYGTGTLMAEFLKEDFKEEYLELPLKIKNEDYYVKMMTAWFYATALAFHWEETVSVLENQKLDVWTHNKTIQKAKESFRITGEQKEYLKKLKIRVTGS